MALTAKRLAQFVATASAVSYYTVPTNSMTMVKQIIVANTTAGAVNLHLSVVPSGGVAGNSNRIIPGTSIPGQASVVFDFSIVMAQGDFISAVASAASSLTVTISGLEDPASNGLSSGSALTTPITWGTPVDVGTANAQGALDLLARSDHIHAATFGTPVATGSVNATGSAGTLARSDHVHLGALPDSGWTAPTMLNSWVNYDTASYPACGYRKIDTRVFLRGLIKNGTSTLAVFTLPVGYRPLRYLHIPAVGNDAIGTIRVSQSTGDVTATGSTAWFSLDGCSFFVD
jgi:hypothetical protein